jgi:hypothetical protein
MIRPVGVTIRKTHETRFSMDVSTGPDLTDLRYEVRPGSMAVAVDIAISAIDILS